MGTLQSIIISQAAVLSGNMSEFININTLFGAVVVLAILFLIMCITYFVNIKPNLNNSNSGTVANHNSAESATVQNTGGEDGELVDDCELVAVITAAIYASMGENVPADGFVVRSIRRVNSKKWMNS